jgi:hypothetical protein
MTGRESVIAVVDDSGQGVCVWWVTIDPEAETRMCGAWVLTDGELDKLEPLLFARMVLPTKSGRRALLEAKVAPDRVVDINATLAAAVAERARLQEAFDAEQASRPPSKRLKEPRWPGFPEPLDDLENPPPWDVNHPSEDHLDRALSISHWVSGLCSRWADLEEERLSRPVLRDLAEPHARPIPVVLT